MTESNWHAWCKVCGEFIGPAHIDSNGGGSFFRIDRSGCKCPRDQANVEIVHLGMAPPKSAPKNY